MIVQYSQYKNDFFNKLDFNFQNKKKILDVGCGEATDALILRKEYNLKYYGIDIVEHENIQKYKISFKKANATKIPFRNASFDYVFAHDLLHHIDEPKHKKNQILASLKEIRRVCKKNGAIVIVEANRFNPLFYPHMVIIRGHNHFTQDYFTQLIKEIFKKDKKRFHFFEAHAYPKNFLFLFKIYEFIMEHFFPKQFIAYNAVMIKKNNEN